LDGNDETMAVREESNYKRRVAGSGAVMMVSSVGQLSLDWVWEEA
jgi:hypothetical protein